MMLPWLYDEMADMEKLMGPDPWPYGLKANRPILTAFMRYLVDQHFLPAARPIDDLFAPIVQWTE
jgi:4,5-dihydroxyphthalate decarboxylase